MRFCVGYQIPEEGEDFLVDIVGDFRQQVDEVYFPWLDLPSGRSPMTSRHGFVDWEAQRNLERDLAAFKRMGVKLDLLLNASCYGRYAVSRSLLNLVTSVIDHLQNWVGVDVVTTMSPVIAGAVQRDFSEIDVRASVNMRLGTVRALEYVADIFDSFHLQREYNRDLERIEELRSWCSARGKGLCLLANSGCLNFCSVQTFHDNLVAHEKEANEQLNLSGLPPALCWDFYRKRENWPVLLQGSWVRPEDVHHYEGLTPAVKLATRMHANPRQVVEAYCRGTFDGNLLDLLEPGHGPLLAPYVIDNARFPDDWFERTTDCDKKCHACEYCANVLETVLSSTGQPGAEPLFDRATPSP